MSEPQGIVKLYRESHHRIAEMVALGYTPSKIRQELGVSKRRLTLLLQDPTFQELIASKTARIEEKIEKEMDLYAQTAVANMLQAEFAVQDAISEHCDEPEGQRLSVTVLNKIAMDRADRFGYGKNATVKVEHEFGSMLDRAIARSGLKQVGPPATPLLELKPEAEVPVVTAPTAKSSGIMTPAPQRPLPQSGRVSLSDLLRRRRVA